MTDKWSGLADLLASMIEKYAVEIGIDNLPDPSPKSEAITPEKVKLNFSESSIEKEKAA